MRCCDSETSLSLMCMDAAHRRAGSPTGVLDKTNAASFGGNHDLRIFPEGLAAKATFSLGHTLEIPAEILNVFWSNSQQHNEQCPDGPRSKRKKT